MNKNIINKDKNGNLYGYQERYNDNNKLLVRGNWKNDIEIGYEEYHYIKETNFYIR